ncbi:hypothetical protein, partial [Streptomyces tunisiensis]|uniref:hypothetical protein n=1 Tax=Streptomyces tunisiensis TaxID=948699 RepID=UPI00403E0513
PVRWARKDVTDGTLKELDFPDKSKKFFGYTERTLENPEGIEIPITKELILINGLIATTILASKGLYIANKDDALTMYKKVINDQWTSLLEDTYYFCRDKHKYLIPENSDDQNKLKEICEKTLEFENYFLKFVLNL